MSSDPDAMYARAEAAGAEMVIEIEDKPYSGRGFTCRDPEGHLWHVGSYDPWHRQPKRRYRARDDLNSFTIL